MRRLHAFAGISGFVLVAFMAVTGALLSLQPLLDTATTYPATGTPTVADVAGRVSAQVPGVERLVRSASGRIVAYASDGQSRSAIVVDPDTGAVMAPYTPSPFFSFVTELHRSLFLETGGHAAAGVASVAILVLSVSGIGLLLRKLGGWRQLLGPARGAGSQRLHTTLARVVIMALFLTAASGAYMSADYFELLPGAEAGFTFAPEGSGATPAPVTSLEALAAVPLNQLRELVFPAVGDPSDVFTLTTASGVSYVDQATGEVLAFKPNSAGQRAYELVYMLHTGQGMPAWAVVLGLGALAVPLLGATGVGIWWSRRRRMPRVAHNASPRDADTVILVGSESGSTWGFAANLHEVLTAGGHRVHLAAMSDLRPVYLRANRLLVLAATYGDGEAPASARQFIGRLKALRSRPAFAVLGFGDRSFPQFCAYANEVEAALSACGLKPLLPLHAVDRQSPAEFAKWGRLLGEATGTDIRLSYAPPRPATRSFVLDEHSFYGVEVQAPVCRLRFTAPSRQGLYGWLAGNRLPRFEAGDLVGILPPGSDVPRYYSIASASRDGVLEICVRKQAGGLCSEYLHGLLPGDAIAAFIRPNPDFRPNRSRRPLVLVGAGAGVAPLAGFIRHNRRRPVHLYFGARDPRSDFLYREEFDEALADGRLASLSTAFSRVLDGAYVQDRLGKEASAIRQLVRDGAQIMVCGGRNMADGVRQAIDAALAPLGLTVEALKRKGLYLEDAY